MKIHEYQAKEILKEYGIFVPPSELVLNHIAAMLTATNLGTPVMVKAQVHAGGRGKAGGVKRADSPDEAREIAASLLNKKLKTSQTPGDGILVQKLLVEKKLETQKEFYLAVALDRAREYPVIIGSDAGGMGIEEIARTQPDKIYTEEVHPLLGLQAFQKRKLAFSLGIDPEIVSKLYRIFEEKDCLLAEINPLILAPDNQFYALDAKMVFDDNALFRHPEIRELADFSMEDPLEAEAVKYGANYVRLEGNIGCMVNGAGLAMATMDTIKQLGGQPANFLDMGGGAKPEQIEIAFRILTADPNVKVVLINVFGGILRYDSLVAGLVRAVDRKDIQNIPLVVRLEGEGAKEGIKLLKKAGLNFVTASSMQDGIKKAIKLAEEVK